MINLATKHLITFLPEYLDPQPSHFPHTASASGQSSIQIGE